MIEFIIVDIASFSYPSFLDNMSIQNIIHMIYRCIKMLSTFNNYNNTRNNHFSIKNIDFVVFQIKTQ